VPVGDGKVEIQEFSCVLPGTLIYEVVGESPDDDCSEVPGATTSLSKLAAEGAGYWCSKPTVPG
jgi:hypothetical protein